MGFTSEYMGSLVFKSKVLDLRNVETEEKFSEGIYRLRINHFSSDGGISCRAIEKSDFIQFLKDSFEKYKHNDIIQCQLLCCITELVNRSRLPVIPAGSHIPIAPITQIIKRGEEDQTFCETDLFISATESLGRVLGHKVQSN